MKLKFISESNAVVEMYKKHNHQINMTITNGVMSMRVYRTDLDEYCLVNVTGQFAPIYDLTDLQHVIEQIEMRAFSAAQFNERRDAAIA